MAIQLSYVEKDVEDLLEERCAKYLGLEFVKRQHRTDVGIVDVIARHPYIPRLHFVIEIKRGLLDAEAYVQALRYASWLNLERSKNGLRLFVPLLIGESLGESVSRICEYFEPRIEWYPYCGRVYYRLFKFDPLSGVSMSWASTAAEQYRKSLVNRFHHISHLDESAAYIRDEYLKHSALHRLADEPGKHLSLVKNEEEAA